MSNTPETFWSESINPSSHSIPKTLLKQQAASLGSITKNIVQGDISSSIDADEGDGFMNAPKIVHSFDIVAPLLGYQKFTLFYVTQIIGLDFPLTFNSKFLKGFQNRECKNFEEFNIMLRQVLSSSQTVEFINSIIAQSS